MREKKRKKERNGLEEKGRKRGKSEENVTGKFQSKTRWEANNLNML